MLENLRMNIKRIEYKIDKINPAVMLNKISLKVGLNAGLICNFAQPLHFGTVLVCTIQLIQIKLSQSNPPHFRFVASLLPQSHKLDFSKTKFYLYHRFPKLKGLPISETRVCQYENSLDGNFIINWHSISCNSFK